MSSRVEERTDSRLRRVALQLFMERGFDTTSVAAVAMAAGVSHMTFFRHFPTKESVVVQDVFDPAIAAAVAAQPASWTPLVRSVHGLVTALDSEEARAELASVEFRQRVVLAASTPSLRAAMWSAGRETEDAVARVLLDGGASELAARAASGALMGAATSLLLAWASGPGDADAAAGLREGLLALIGEGS